MMLLINNLQTQQLAQATDEVFLKTVAARVSVHWPQRCERLGPQALLTRLRSVGQVALGYGIVERPGDAELQVKELGLGQRPIDRRCDIATAPRCTAEPGIVAFQFLQGRVGRRRVEEKVLLGPGQLGVLR